MQVTHKEDFDTHAIIGGSDVIAFEVAQTAEFFEVLSNTLYSDKPLAVVREVLCNAWDIHIVTKRQNIPVEITLDETKLVIRDHGTGIKHEMIGPTYCTYGNSTKGNDGEQTGGFGLGSKAPFAYSHHLSVTSHFEGTKTVYAISRGSIKTQGRPDCRVMVRVPTQESGLEVNIPLKQAADKHMFEEIIRNIVRLGEMNVTLNGEKLSTMPISEGKEGYYFTRSTFSKAQERLFVRYGNVVYPIPRHEDYEGTYAEVVKFLNNLPDPNSYHQNSSNAWKVIFQAPANKISVTPSRESLSLTETTINTLKELMKKIPVIGSSEYNVIGSNMVKTSIVNAWKDQNQWKMLTLESLFKDSSIAHNSKEFTNYKDAVEASLKRYYPSEWAFKYADISQRMESFIHQSPANKHVFVEYLKVLGTVGEETVRWTGANSEWSAFCTRFITGPLVKRVLKSDKVDLKNLYVVTPNDYRTRGTGPKYTPITKYSSTYEQATMLLKNLVIVAESKISISDYLHHNPEMKVWDNGHTKLVYLAPRTKNGRTDAVEFFKSIKMNVIDHAQYVADNFKDTPVISASPKPVKPKILGIPSLKNLLKSTGRIDPRGHMITTPVRIEDPEFIFQPHNLSGQSYSHRFFQAKDEIFGQIVVSLYGDKGGIVVNSRQYDAYIKKGSKDGYAWVGERLLEEFQTNQKLLNQISWKLVPWLTVGSKTQATIESLYQVSLHSPVIKQALKFPDKLTSEENDLLRIYSEIRPVEPGEYAYGRSIPSAMLPFVKQIKDLIDKQGIHPQLTVVKDLVENSSLFRLLHFSEMVSILSNPKSDQKQKDNVETLLLLALQG
ncbi:RIIA lysis inhibitor [Sinorhizobium phage ort11]|uniref:RIIA lysis inhibitor n=1 Tax=Sinorhizobium phage ort11 TaxID=2599764 RepID=A0A5C2H8X9_9CAUD|nr:RIIA lysis inhibitor [Sinorhizobium phage ort11]QEP29849.1 rIIA lysis inhibitor [Sinorhizobium phage ort11]